MKKTEIIPVIHMLTEVQVIKNVKVCIDHGIKKVFLINHACDNDILLETALNVKTLYPDLWVGVNFLGLKPFAALTTSYVEKLDGIWSDHTISKMEYNVARSTSDFKGLYFGGLAFKYQAQPTDLVLACDEAISSTDVATTSGPGTGLQADENKIRLIRHHLGNHPMALASGVSADNVGQYAGALDYLLVASSITQHGSEMIIPEKLEELIQKLNENQNGI